MRPHPAMQSLPRPSQPVNPALGQPPPVDLPTNVSLQRALPTGEPCRAEHHPGLLYLPNCRVGSSLSCALFLWEHSAPEACMQTMRPPFEACTAATCLSAPFPTAHSPCCFCAQACHQSTPPSSHPPPRDEAAHVRNAAPAARYRSVSLLGCLLPSASYRGIERRLRQRMHNTTTLCRAG